jgi:hypothetical protein
VITRVLLSALTLFFVTGQRSGHVTYEDLDERLDRVAKEQFVQDKQIILNTQRLEDMMRRLDRIDQHFEATDEHVASVERIKTKVEEMEWWHKQIMTGVVVMVCLTMLNAFLHLRGRKLLPKVEGGSDD